MKHYHCVIKQMITRVSPLPALEDALLQPARSLHFIGDPLDTCRLRDDCCSPCTWRLAQICSYNGGEVLQLSGPSLPYKGPTGALTTMLAFLHLVYSPCTLCSERIKN